MVVSIANITSAHGSRYYAQEGNISEAEQASRWSGKLAEVLGLTIGHPVEPEVLTYLLHGKSAGGTALTYKPHLLQQQLSQAIDKAVPNKRAGIDLTVSAPKSVSIQSLIFGDRSLALVP